MLGGVVLLALGGCDQLKERAGIPDPAKVEAEGKAIGSACRHAGWGLEDCFRLNQEASKPAMFAGWKEMNEYMLKNDMQAMEPTVSPEGTAPHASPKKKKKVIELEPIDQVDKAGEHGKEAGAEADKAAHAEKTAPDPDKKAAAH
jgi:hypothetical protein